jgi:TRAP-type C4-dicarboxylate transport system permease small subunit
MTLFEKISKKLARLLDWVAGAAIISMLLLTCADVILRLGVTLYHNYHWGFLDGVKPIPGTYELVSFLGAVAVSFAMAHTSAEKGHVAVSLVVRLLPKKAQGLIGTITSLLGFILFALLCWQSISYAHELQVRGDLSLTLQVPYYPFVYGVGLSSAAVCMVLLVELSNNVLKVINK